MNEINNKIINITVLSSDNLFDVISNNYKYYDTFTQYDWKARNVRDYNQYMFKVMFSVIDFSENDITKLEKAVLMTEEKIEYMSEIYKNGWNWLDWKKFKKIKWSIGCIYGNNYEGGYPHTVGDVIILSKEILRTYSISELACLLIHEKIHIYQRKYPNDAKKYIKLNNFTIYRKKRKTDRFRANPDLNQYIYERRGEIYSLEYKEIKEYKNGDRGSVDHVVNRYGKKVVRKEHPYEEMAYFIEKMCRKL